MHLSPRSLRLLLPAAVLVAVAAVPAVAAADDGFTVDTQVRRAGDSAWQDEIVAHVGDRAEYLITVSDPAGGTWTDVVATADDCDAAPVMTGGDANGDGALGDGEQWTYRCDHLLTADDLGGYYGAFWNWGSATADDPSGGHTGSGDAPPVYLIDPRLRVVKDGPAQAYPGDTVHYAYTVTNDGDPSLHDVTLGDDRCAPVTGPVAYDGDDDDVLDSGEAWHFTCDVTVPPGHTGAAPIASTATATARDELDATVTATDGHVLRILHPAIALAKSGPATAVAGAPLSYALAVGNPGDTPFAAGAVAVTDPRCAAAPAGPATGGDATPGSLDPGDRWVYTCTAPTAGQSAGTFVNRAKVTARDANGRQVSDADAFATTLTAPSAAPARTRTVARAAGRTRRPGSARLSGPSGCVHSAFTATVRGRRIARVTFVRDGARIARVAGAPGRRVFTARVRPGAAQGVHRVIARVTFRRAAGTTPRTLRLTFHTCPRAVVLPRFAG